MFICGRDVSTPPPVSTMMTLCRGCFFFAGGCLSGSRPVCPRRTVAIVGRQYIQTQWCVIEVLLSGPGIGAPWCLASQIYIIPTAIGEGLNAPNANLDWLWLASEKFQIKIIHAWFQAIQFWPPFGDAAASPPAH